MRTRSIVYWVTTSLIAVETLAGGAMDLTHGRTGVVEGEPVVDVVTRLGYPTYVLTILGILKIPAALALLLPGLPRLKEWAYAGIVFELTVAAASQAGTRQAPMEIATPVMLAVLAASSWALRPASRKLEGRPSRSARP